LASAYFDAANSGKASQFVHHAASNVERKAVWHLPPTAAITSLIVMARWCILSPVSRLLAHARGDAGGHADEAAREAAPTALAPWSTAGGRDAMSASMS
jgi:hypothetical protein